jgi:hypothetical protein
MLNGSTLTTYNINRQTLQASDVGTITLPNPGSPDYVPTLVASPNGRFVYISVYLNNNDQEEVYVYDTNASGLPGQSPVQQIKASQLIGVAVDPSGKFLYSVAVGPPGQQLTTPYSIVRGLISANNGKLSQPVTEAKYLLDSDPSGNDCYLAVLGFNGAGTTMYDGIFCSGPHASGSATYNQRSVDPQTGALGPDQQVYVDSSYAGSESANVQFEGDLFFAFIAYFNQGPNANLVDVYQMPNDSTPVISCGASMLAVCGDFTHASAHPSGKYVFLTDPTNVTDIGTVNLSTEQITQTGSIPYPVQEFSPDGTIAYAVNDGDGEIDIYGFNAATGGVTQGGSFSDLGYLFTAERK